jgi:hypothetical protein
MKGWRRWTGRWLYIVLYTVHCTVHRTLYCTPYIVLYTVHWTPYIEHCTLYTVHCTLYIVHRTLYTVYCTPYIVHRILYTVHIIPPDAGQHCSLHKHTNTNATTARFVVFIGGGGVSRNACCVRIPQLVTAYTGRGKFKKVRAKKRVKRRGCAARA